MPSDVTREEFQHLAARTSILEREVEGEKLVTRHIFEQTRRNGHDLADVKTRLDRVERKVDDLDRKVDGLDRKVDGLDRKVDGLDKRFGDLEHKVGGLDVKVDDLIKSLPGIVGAAVREANRERDRRG
jgi:uncharacterized protein YoxC